MAEASAGQVHGEYQPFDINRVAAPAAKHVFVCPTVHNLMIQLKKDRKYVVDGHVISEPGKFAHFQAFRFFTDDDEVADMVRKTKLYQMGRIMELGAAKEQAKTNQADAILKALAADPELEAQVAGALRPAKSSSPKVEAKVEK